MEIVLVLSVVIIYCSVNCYSLNNVSGYYIWSSGNRTDLYCPDACKTSAEPESCCSCDARRCWEITPKVCPMSTLKLEYKDARGHGILISSANTTYTKLEHVNGRLSSVPGNVCTFSESLVILDLRENRLNNISSLRCLHKLDTLRLDGNRISELNNITFSDMNDLRIVSLKNNPIKNLGANVIKAGHGNIFTADFSDNHGIESIDITNIMHKGPFCMVDFSNTSLEHFTNELAYKINNAMHGPGDINLQHTQLGTFLNFSLLGVPDYGQIAQFFKGEVLIDDSSVACDCALYPFVANVSDYFVYWPNIYENNFTCNSPESVKGFNIARALKNRDFDALTCDISESPDCPHYLCHCIQQPSQGKILVNCTGVGLKSLPPTMPIGSWGLNKIDLVLDKNEIESIEYRDYLPRLVNLNLKENAIKNFDEDAAKAISAPINLEDQILTTLPIGLKDRDPNYYIFGDHPVLCDCSNLWIGDWMRYHDGHDRLNCLVNEREISAEKVDASMLQCQIYHSLPAGLIITPLVASITALVILIGLFYTFKYDVLLFHRRLFQKKNGLTPPNASYDIFISFYEHNSDVFGAVRRYFKPELQRAGYSTFIPHFDIVCGDKDIEMRKAVNMSRNYVVVLCKNYTDDSDTINEFDTIWTSFLNDQSKYIFVIDFDNIESGSVHDNRLKALRRTKYCLDFVERDCKLVDRLMKALGDPIAKPKQDDATKRAVNENGTNPSDELEVQDGDAIMLHDMKNDREESVTENVFNRLSKPKEGNCNCQYRVCYLHDRAFEERQVKITKILTTISSFPENQNDLACVSLK
ncbi:hypothetical protein ACF0H5_016918 [Mactra antiquata]